VDHFTLKKGVFDHLVWSGWAYLRSIDCALCPLIEAASGIVRPLSM